MPKRGPPDCRDPTPLRHIEGKLVGARKGRLLLGTSGALLDEPPFGQHCRVPRNPLLDPAKRLADRDEGHRSSSRPDRSQRVFSKV